MLSMTDLTGTKVGRWEVTGLRSSCQAYPECSVWYVKCGECGRVKWMFACDIEAGKKLPCSCSEMSYPQKVPIKRGDAKNRLYRIWFGMRTRCENPNNQYAKYYFQKGVRVCDEWRDSFYAFRDWSLANGYADNLTIDRIDNSLGYSPENCRWVTRKQQARNKTNSLCVEINGNVENLCDLCDKHGMSYQAVYSRLRYLKAKKRPITEEALFATTRNRASE